MAATFDGTGYLRQTSPFNYNAAYTVCMWLKIATGGGAWIETYTSSTQRDLCQINGNKIASTIRAGSSNASVDRGDYTDDVWFHIAIVRSTSTSIQLYKDAVALSTPDTLNVGARTAASHFNISAVCTVSACKIWTAALSAAELENEMRTFIPKRTTNLWAWYPIQPGATHRARDYSGAGRNLTENATITDGVEPGISWGASPIYVDNGAYTPPATTSDPLNLYRRGLRRYFVGA